MTSIKDLLIKTVSILKRNIAVVSKNDRITYPLEEEHFNLDFEELKENVNTNYKGYSIYSLDNTDNVYYICIQAKEYEDSDLIKLLLLSFESMLKKADFNEDYIKKIISGNYEQSDILKLQQSYGNLINSYLLLIENAASKDSINEVHEIIRNTFNTILILDYADRILVIAEDENIIRSAEDLAENLLTELYLECAVAVGGKLDNIAQLPQIYDNCLNALYLKRKYDIAGRVLHYDNMYNYRIAFSLSEELKSSIIQKVFTPKFKEALNSEMETTIEEFFKCNLNLTDTANRLYVHRNTLLYRIEKIYKYTGFDLRKFEDCWLFKLAWVIGKQDLLR